MIRLVLVLICLVCVKCTSRDKRQLIFPPQSIMQLAFGVVTPAQVQNRQIATNMGIMFNIDLPTNVSVWYPWRTDYRRKRSLDTDQAFYSLLQTALSSSVSQCSSKNGPQTPAAFRWMFEGSLKLTMYYDYIVRNVKEIEGCIAYQEWSGRESMCAEKCVPNERKPFRKRRQHTY